MRVAESAPFKIQRDPWHHLTRFTPARIALGRAGASQPTAALLDFRLAHAGAKDAVWMEFHADIIEKEIQSSGLESLQLQTAAHDRQAFLARPDLGRRLSSASVSTIESRRAAWGSRDLAIIVSDGLSALAAERQAVPTILELARLLRDARWTLYPILIVPFARVKLQDEIGALIGARHSVMLLGERPGLGSPDSLGAYLTYHPNPERTDADRNCVSNIRPEGQPPANAARQLASQLIESARRGVSGIALKGPVAAHVTRIELEEK